jgi:lysophospholipase L1-like esterase
VGEPFTDDDDPQSNRPFPRRSLLRFGTVAAAGAGAAALIPALADPAAAATLTPSMSEAFGGVKVPPRSLERWMCSPKPIRHVVCIGDSITAGGVGGFNYAAGKKGSWPERLATAASHPIGPDAGLGFRGLWRLDGYQPEWRKEGNWTGTTRTDPFDVGLFGRGIRSIGGSATTLTWTKPSNVSVAGFDLYWFNAPNAGNWQYRVDNGAWLNMNQTRPSADNKLYKFYVGRPMQSSVQIRAHNGTAACLAPIGGIGIYSVDPNTSHGLIVHNLGADGQTLANLVRTSSGDPLAWFDAVVSNPESLKIQPDLVIAMFSNDVALNDITRFRNDLTKFVDRVRPYADVLLMNPYERGGSSPSAQSNYRATTASLAAAKNCGLLDLYQAYASAGATGYAQANGVGLMYDGAHPSQLGHNDISARVWRLLRTFS